MENIQALAISKATDKLAKGKDIEIGSHEVDLQFIVSVKGTLNRAENTDKIPTSSIPLKMTLALLLEKAGVVGPAAANMLKEAMTEAVILGENANETIAQRLKDIDKAEALVKKTLQALPKVPVKGKLTHKLDIDIQVMIPEEMSAEVFSEVA